MGLYRIPIWHEKIEAMPGLLQSIGFPVVRTEPQEGGIRYHCSNPKRPTKNWTFAVTRLETKGPFFFSCGLSQLSKLIVNRLNLEGIFNKEYSEKDVHDIRRKKLSRRTSIKA